MSEVVLLFAGQGAQKVGMGKDFHDSSTRAREMFVVADQRLGMPLSSVMFGGPDAELTRTSYCQPALMLHGLVALELLRERVPDLQPVAAAGLSLGEFTAHAAAGSLTMNEGLRLVARRGEFMEDACAKAGGAMAAMIGGEEEAVVELAADCDIDVANFNAPGQIVVSGSAEGVAEAVARAKERGIRKAVKLRGAGAYHSRLMEEARERLAMELKTAEIERPSIPVICNYEAREVAEPDEIREMLEKQVTGSVRWTESIRLLVERGHRRFVELGPGKILSGLVSKIAPEVEVLAVEDLPSLEAAAEALAG